MGQRGELFSTRILLQNRTYFFNVKENRMGDLYLNIVESKNRDDGGFDRQSVILFADDLQEFLKGFDESLRVLEKEIRERRRSARPARPPRDDARPARDDGREERGRGRDGDGSEGYGRRPPRKDDRRSGAGPERPRRERPSREGFSGRDGSSREGSSREGPPREGPPGGFREGRRIVVKKR